MNDFEQRIALVTGSASGLGQSIATQLAARGARVIVNYSRSAQEAEATADHIRSLGADVKVVQADVAQPEGCRALAEVAAAWGGLDVLVNNAGITRHASNHADLDALSKADFMDIYAVNVVGAYLMLQAAKPLLLASYEQHQRASVVLNTSSIAGVKGIGSSVAYAASQGALNTMTVDLARALAPAIRVNAICPGFIGTRWFKNAMDEASYQAVVERIETSTPLRAASGPDDIAETALFLLSDASRHITGELLLVDAGLHLNHMAG